MIKSLSPSVQLAQDRLRKFKDENDASLQELATIIGVDAKKLRFMLSQKTGPNMYADVVMEKLGADLFNNTFALLRRNRGKQSKTTGRRTAALPDNSASIKTKAMRQLDEYKASTELKWFQLSIALGYQANHLIVLRNKYKNGKLTQSSARDLIKRIEARLTDDGSSEDHQNTASTPDTDTQQKTAGDDVGVAGQISKDSQVETNLVVAKLEDVLGINTDDLTAIRPQIEMLIAARRNHIPARVVIDPVGVV